VADRILINKTDLATPEVRKAARLFCNIVMQEILNALSGGGSSRESHPRDKFCGSCAPFAVFSGAALHHHRLPPSLSLKKKKHQAIL
jgi:hypothetical protein